MTEFLTSVRRLADDVLFASALDVDRSGVIPATHWQALADAGLYGLAASPGDGGMGVGFPEVIEALETMASACLATTFTFVQHHGLVMSLSASTNTALREVYLADLVSGRVRAGVAFAGVIPDPPRVRCVRVDGGWSLTGDAPFVSGWGIVHVLQLSSGDVETGDIINGIVDGALASRNHPS
jgi:alkylation response protein AidB-like acyl-CoA dehydrogenase